MKRRVPLVIALALVLAGAFAVSASSTWLLGERHNLDSLARVALVLMLEVGNVTGAAIYVATTSTGLRVRAGIVVGIATSVAATGGVQAYGFLIGVPVAALLLLLVDVIAVYWHESTEASTTTDHVDQGSTALAWEPTDHPLDAPLREERDEELRRLREVSRVPWPAPWERFPQVETLHVAGYRDPSTGGDERVDDEPTGPLPLLDEPETEEQAARRLIAAGRTTERQLLDALTAEDYPATRYRVKKYLGNATRRLEAVEMEATG